MIVHLSSLKLYKLVRKKQTHPFYELKGVLKSCYLGVLKIDSTARFPFPSENTWKSKT